MPIHPIIDPAAVEGDAPGGFGSGVRGRNSIGEAEGVLGGTDPVLFQPVGAYGMSNNQGVVGLSKGDGAGVFGSNNSNGPKGRGVQGNGPEAGVGGFSDAGNGVLAQSKSGIAILAQGGGKAGRFEGDVEVTGDIRLVNQDLAEEFDIQETAEAEPGSVMVFDSDGKLHPCRQPYDKKVAGVIAGAGACKPAIVLGKLPSLQGRLPIALVGRAYCKVDARYGRVEVGDLLTASPTLGHAMKAADPFKSFGAVIGKALHALDSGRSLIPILIALQ